MRLKIGARQSDLARLQAYRVADALKKKDPSLEISFEFKTSLGDQNQSDPLWQMPQKGVFTEDFVADLREGRVDMVVHSWKDLPTEPRVDSEIAGTLPREDVRDLFLLRKSRIETIRTDGKLRVLTSSPRRVFNIEPFLRSYLPMPLAQIAFMTVRGNIPTRIKKLIEGDCDALIVAKAAVDRLLSAPEEEFAPVKKQIRAHLAQCLFMVVPASVNPAAAAQGAIAIEIPKNSKFKDLVNAINCEKTFADVTLEREKLASYGGGCHQKIGISFLTRSYGRIEILKGLTDSGQALDKLWLHRPGTEIPKFATSELFPGEEDVQFFGRKELPVEKWKTAKSADALWVSRDGAWPEALKNEKAWVWTAGLDTWKKLARREIWVHGSSEGLGEVESPAIEWLISTSDQPKVLKWKKLSHQAAEDYQDLQMEMIYTYQLQPLSPKIFWQGKKAAYWKSASSFDQAVLLGAPVQNLRHASGPGLTHQYLVRRLAELGVKTPPEIYLDREQWREVMTGKKP